MDILIELRQPEPESDQYDGDKSIEAIIKRIYIQLESMLRFESGPRGSWLVHQVVAFFIPRGSMDPEVTHDEVSWLLWEEINAGRIDIDKHGGLSRGAALAV